MEHAKRIVNSGADERGDYFSMLIVGASGALVGAGFGFGVPGAVVGALVGLWAGWDSQRGRSDRAR